MEESHQPRSPGRLALVLGDRLGVTPSAVVIGALAVLAAAGGAWWALATPDPPPPEEILPRADETVALVTTTTEAAPDVLVVHVDGAVSVPGVHEILPGSRVIDAVEAAGGLTPTADRARLNLAQPIGDGQRVWVPAIGEAEPVVVAPEGPDGGPGDDPAGGALVDLNTADLDALESLPGVGPTIAAAIIDHREREGPYRSIDSLQEVPGIGAARLAQIEPLVTV